MAEKRVEVSVDFFLPLRYRDIVIICVDSLANLPRRD